MSEIPYVNQLGDAFDEALAKSARTRRLPRLGRRRYLAVALAALAVGGGGAAVAGLFTDPVEIGFGAVACFDGPSTDGDVAIVSDPTHSAVDVCAAALAGDGLEARDLIACRWQNHGIVVLPHEGRANCAALDLAPLPRSYRRARLRAARLQALAIRFERGAGCLPPAEFARRLTGELRARGWPKWRAVPGGGRGPCGRVSVPTGAALLGSIGPSVDATRRTISIKGRASLRVERVIYGGVGSPGVRLFDSSGERCFTLPALEEHVRMALAPARVPIRFRHGSMPPDTGVEQPRGRRYAQGCAIFVGAEPAFRGGETEIVVELWQRDVAG
jgi:hypothetical protein